MQNLLKISQQTFWQLIGKVVSSLTTFIVLGLIARNFGEEGTGIYTLAVTYLAIFFLLSDFGFNAHVLRRVKNLESRVKEEWQRLLGARIMWSAVLVVLAVGLLPFWPFATPEFSQAVLFGSLAIVASAVFVTCNLIFQSKLRYDLSVIASSIGTVLGLAVFVYLILLKYSIPHLMLAYFLGWMMIAVVALLLVRKFWRVVFPIYDQRYTTNLFKTSWPIAATLLLNVVYFRADAFILSTIKGTAQVGIYNVAYSVFQTVLVLPTFIMNAFYPMMLETLKFQIDRFKNQIRMVALGLIVVSAILSFVIFTISPQLIKLITGSGFGGSSISLQILSFGFPAYFLSALFMWIMVAKKMYKQMLIIYSLGLIFNIILNFIYIPQYSFMAASLITVISEYLILIMQAVLLLISRK